MAAAEQDEVARLHLATVGPVLKVVAVGPLRRPVAARKAAAMVPSHQGAPKAGWDRAGGPVDAQQPIVAVDRDDREGGIAGDPEGRLTRNDPGTAELATRRGLLAGERFRADDQGDVGPPAGRLHPLPGQFDQGVGSALGR